MRALVVMGLLVGCGGGGLGDGADGGDAGAPRDLAQPSDLGEVCRMLEQQMLTVANANQSCTQDSDCFFAYDIGPEVSVPGCSVFYDTNGAAQMTSLMQQFHDAGCITSCLAPKPHCNQGICGS
jgi:hypothetical protein